MTKKSIDFFSYLQQIGLVSSAITKKRITSTKAIAKATYLPEELIAFYQQQYNDTPQSLPDQLADDVKKLIPAHICREHSCVPYHIGDTLTVCAINPYDDDMRDSVEAVVDIPISYHLCSREQMISLLNVYYPSATSDKSMSQMYDSNTMSFETIDQLIDNIIIQGFDLEASDIHFLWQKDALHYKSRRYGQFHPGIELPVRLAQVLKNRVLVRSSVPFDGLDEPQDCSLTIAHTPPIPVRISYMPTVDGYSLVARIIKPVVSADLESVLHAKQLYQLDNYLTKSRDFLIIHGATGSGKTTVYYNIMERLIKLRKKVITMEDPIEKVVSEATQIDMYQTDQTYDDVLKKLLRQDPNAIMISELRSVDGVKTIANAKMSGCMTVATMHAANAVESLIKLIKLGYPQHELFNQHLQFLSCYLLPTLCPECRYKDVPNSNQAHYLQAHFGHITEKKFYKADGCVSCHFTGIKNVKPFYHLLSITQDQIMKITQQKDWQLKSQTELILPLKHKLHNYLEKELLSGEINLDTLIRISMC